jgi:hypothetical protein
MDTIKLNPNLASHAPKVSIIILIVGMIILFSYIRRGIYITNDSIMPSKHNNDIKKWVRCDRNAIEVA